MLMRFFLLILISLLTIGSFDLRAQFLKWEAYELISYERSQSGDYEETNSYQIEYLVTTNYDKQQIKIFSKETQVLDIVEYGESETTVDYTYQQMTCVDQNGEEPLVYHKLFSDSDLSVLMVFYKNIGYAIRMKVRN